MVFSLVDTFLSAVAIFIIWRWRKHTQALAKSKGFPLPPGPPQKPLIGNLFDIPQERAWHKFLEWRRKFGLLRAVITSTRSANPRNPGDIVYVEALGNRILLLNTIEGVSDLLDKRPNNYSDRPTLVMVGELMGLAQVIPPRKFNEYLANEVIMPKVYRYGKVWPCVEATEKTRAHLIEPRSVQKISRNSGRHNCYVPRQLDREPKRLYPSASFVSYFASRVCSTPRSNTGLLVVLSCL